MKNTVLAFLLFCSATAGAQDYVVTLKNDTLRGDVKIFTYDRMDRLDVTVGKKKEHFTCIQLKTVYLKNEIYSPVRTDAGYRFMQLKTPGYLSVYLSRRPNGFLYEAETLVKRDGSAMEVPGLSFKKLISAFLEDCPTVVERVRKDELTRKQIADIVTQYNQCIDTQTKIGTTIGATSTSTTIDPVIDALGDLKKKVEATTTVSQKDAIDIIKDISNKVGSNQTIPGYLIEGLKESVKASPELLADVEKILPMLKR